MCLWENRLPLLRLLVKNTNQGTSLPSGLEVSMHLPVICFTLGDDKVNMLNHTYLHKPLRKIKLPSAIGCHM